MRTVFAIILIKLFLNIANCNLNSSPLKYKKQLKVFWNIPTFQCDSHKINFTELAKKYNIIQNNNDRFRGENITILYDPGNFPAILYPESNTKRKLLRNGGVPQEGNLTLHLNLFKNTIDTLIPSTNFSGVGVIDFESWRPIFRQNFGSLIEYKELSIEIEKQHHPFLPKFAIEKEATRRFEFYAREFMEETLIYAKQLRPNATWGYYAYPYCFNMAPKNMHKDCPKNVIKENERSSWLFKNSDNFHPSLYLSQLRLNTKQKILMIEGRIEEAHRLIGYLNKSPINPKIIPYFWYKYQDTRNYLNKDDIYSAFVAIKKSLVDGLIIWGSSNDVKSKQACMSLYDYIDNVLGPALNAA